MRKIELVRHFTKYAAGSVLVKWGNTWVLCTASVSDKVPPFRCGACHGAMAVAPDSTLYPCHRFVGMEAWAIGKLETGPDLDKCKSFWRRYRDCMKASCPSCWAYRVCGGPCPWEIARADGTFAMYPPLCKDACIWIQHGVYYLSKKEAIVSKTGEKGQ